MSLIVVCTEPLDTVLGSVFLSAAMSDWRYPMLVHRSASATLSERPNSPSTIAITTPATASPMIHVLISPPRFALGGRGEAPDDDRRKGDRGERVPRRHRQGQQALEHHDDRPEVGDGTPEAMVGEQRDPPGQRERGDDEVPDTPHPELLAEERVGEIADLA